MSYPSDPEKGWYYVVSVAGEVGGIQYDVGDWIVWNGTSWDRVVGKQLVLPIGAIIMYDGVGIANVLNRTVQIGDEGGDAFKMYGWFVCNGKAGTPDLEKMFVRGGLVSGVVEGSDDAVVVQHNHPASQASHNHGVPRTGSGSSTGKMDATETYAESDPTYTTSMQPVITVDNEGVSGVGKNVPVHYVVIYIKRMS